MKLLDLTRDPRCVLHSATSESSGGQGDFKVTGLAVRRDDNDYRLRYGRHVNGVLGRGPREPYHLFSLDLREAGYVLFGDAAARTAARLAADAAVRVRLFSAKPGSSEYVVAAWRAVPDATQSPPGEVLDSSTELE